MSSRAEIARELAGVRAELERAADALLGAADEGLIALSAAEDGDPAAFAAVRHALLSVVQACAFQDLVGQRLSRLEAGPRLRLVGQDDPLLNGPAEAGLDQAAADALFDSL